MFDKYAAYAQAVQSPVEDARFLRRVYRELTGNEPRTMREDFCGAFALCCEWAKLGKDKIAIGLDIDPEALSYGHTHYKSSLTSDEQSRVIAYERDVLRAKVKSADIICALNFSYFIFHAREQLRSYFKSCREALKRNGLLVVDIFGGTQCTHPSIDTKRIAGLQYFWEQKTFDPISNRAQFYIHFKTKDGQKFNRAFSYDWRMWGIPEIRDLMTEVGFKEIAIYCEGTRRDGSGNGRFTRQERTEAGEVWVAYIIGRR